MLEVGLRRLEEVFHQELRSALSSSASEKPDIFGPKPVRVRRPSVASVSSCDRPRPFYMSEDARGDRLLPPELAAFGPSSSAPAGSAALGNVALEGAQPMSTTVSEKATKKARRQFEKELDRHSKHYLTGDANQKRFYCCRRVSQCVERAQSWWRDLREPHRSGLLVDIFDLIEPIFSIMIICQACMMVYAANQSIHGIVPAWMDTADKVFLSGYTVELCIRFSIHRWYFFCNEDCGWNLLDLVVVVYSGLDMLLMWTNISWLRSLRFLRTVKVLRTFRALRFLKELRMMMQCLLGSLPSLFWSIVMMFLVLYMFSLIFVQNMATYLMETDEVDPVLQADMLAHFGSVEQSMLTLYKGVSGGEDWGTFYNPIASTGLFNRWLFVFFVGFFQIAFLNVVTGIFVENAMRYAEPDREAAAMEMRKNEDKLARELKQILSEFDCDGSGSICPEDFAKAESQAGVRLNAFLASLGIELADALMFFELLGDAADEGSVDIDSFVQGCLRMRGSASSLDMQTMIFEMRVMRNLVRSQACILCDVALKAGIRPNERRDTRGSDDDGLARQGKNGYQKSKSISLAKAAQS